MKGKKRTRRTVIQILDPTPKVLETVKRMAKKEKRSVSGQADVMLLAHIEQNKL